MKEITSSNPSEQRTRTVSKREENTLSTLPDELLEKILENIPCDTRSILACSCRKFHQLLINNPFFLKISLDRNSTLFFCSTKILQEGYASFEQDLSRLSLLDTNEEVTGRRESKPCNQILDDQALNSACTTLIESNDFLTAAELLLCNADNLDEKSSDARILLILNSTTSILEKTDLNATYNNFSSFKGFSYKIIEKLFSNTKGNIQIYNLVLSHELTHIINKQYGNVHQIENFVLSMPGKCKKDHYNLLVYLLSNRLQVARSTVGFDFSLISIDPPKRIFFDLDFIFDLYLKYDEIKKYVRCYSREDATIHPRFSETIDTDQESILEDFNILIKQAEDFNPDQDNQDRIPRNENEPAFVRYVKNKFFTLFQLGKLDPTTSPAIQRLFNEWTEANSVAPAVPTE